MSKFWLAIVGIGAGLVAFANLGPLVVLLLSLFLVYVSYRQLYKTNSKLAKVFWVLLGVAALFTAVANVPAVIGLVALVVLYMVYKKWNKKDLDSDGEGSYNDDPFTNFEREWSNLNKSK